MNSVSKSPQRVGEEELEQDPELIEEVKAAMIRGFLATDKRFLSECHLRGGATATTAFLCGGRIWVANVGDCRAVMCEGGEAVALTHDHRPDRVEERRAVERRGGEVVSILGTSRVQGVLGVSRALGDRDQNNTLPPNQRCTQARYLIGRVILAPTGSGTWWATRRQRDW